MAMINLTENLLETDDDFTNVEGVSKLEVISFREFCHSKLLWGVCE